MGALTTAVNGLVGAATAALLGRGGLGRGGGGAAIGGNVQLTALQLLQVLPVEEEMLITCSKCMCIKVNQIVIALQQEKWSKVKNQSQMSSKHQSDEEESGSLGGSIGEDYMAALGLY